MRNVEHVGMDEHVLVESGDEDGMNITKTNKAG